MISSHLFKILGLTTQYVNLYFNPLFGVFGRYEKAAFYWFKEK